MSSPETTSWIEPKHSFLSIEIFRHPSFLQIEAPRPKGLEALLFSIQEEPDESKKNEHDREEVELESIREPDI